MSSLISLIWFVDKRPLHRHKLSEFMSGDVGRGRALSHGHPDSAAAFLSDGAAIAGRPFLSGNNAILSNRETSAKAHAFMSHGSQFLSGGQDLLREQDKWRKNNGKASSTQPRTNSVNSMYNNSKEAFNWTGVILCIFYNFSYTTCFTVFETIGTPFTESEFGFSVRENGMMWSACGVLALLSIIVLFVWSAKAPFTDRSGMMLCVLFMTVGYGVLIDPHKLPLIRFFICIFFVVTGYSAGGVLLMALLSKILGETEQGKIMGWFQAASAAARVIGPLWSSFALDHGGGNLVFISTTILLVLSTLTNVFFFQKLIEDDNELVIKQKQQENKKDIYADERSLLINNKNNRDYEAGR
eukprot:TRINITY_DN1973_c0_g2_i1.p1 TRINITY_DN1973_c0_g2~~TRINITY_DN1973_c0_g2_i1.p1  ORF type:complete len:355 (-),score=110.88 TRINITY_DN1973_c0_g2_i1:54-1118(-)